MKASWGRSHRIISLPEEIDDVIDSIRSARQPTMLFLESNHGEILVAGIGHRESVVTYVGTDGKSFHSIGNINRTGHLTFLCRDQLDEFLAEMAVPEELAISAIYEFIRTGRKSPAISWEADW